VVETREIDKDLRERLAAVRRKQDLSDIVHGAASSGFIILSALLLALIGEDLVRFSTAGRALLFWLLIFLGGGLIFLRIGWPLLRRMGFIRGKGDLDTAREVGRGIPRVNDRLVNALQLLEDPGTRRLYSGDLINAALADLHAECEGIDFTSTVSSTGLRQMGRVLAVAVLSGVLLFVLFPTAFFGAAERLLHFSEAYALPLPFRFVVEPGSRELIKGESIPIRVQVIGERPGGITIAFRRRGDISFEESMLRPDRAGEFHHRFSSVTETMEYYVHARGIRGETYTLTVIDRPLIRLLRVAVVPPAYSRLPERQQDDNVGDVSALRGSRIRFDIESNKQISFGQISMSDSVVLPLEVSDTRARGTLVLMKEGSYHINLRDRAGTGNTDPVEYTLRIIPDAVPTVTLLTPGENLDITDTTRVNLLAKVGDDYGFSCVRLAYRLVQSKYEKPAERFTYVNLPVPPPGSLEALIPYRWSIADLHLVPEDVVNYCVEVYDNDVISGPKSAISEAYSLRLPSLDEVFAQADRGHEAGIEGMQDALQQANEAQKEMEELKQLVRSSADKMEWQNRQKAEELIRKYEQVRAKMDSVRSAVDRMVADLTKNRVLSSETLEKYQELQQMMAQMASPEFAEALKQLEQAMQQMTPDALRQAMQQFSLSEESFRRSIERTLNLLKRIQIEQKIDEAVRRTEQMIKQQERLRENTENAQARDRARMDQLRTEQREVGEHLQALRREMEDLQKKMEAFPAEMPLGELEHAMHEMEQDSMEQHIDSIGRAMDAMQPHDASLGQRQVLSSMQKLGDHLQKMQQDMRQNQQRQILNAMRRSMRDLLELSRREETIKNQTESLEPNSRRFRDSEEAQMGLMRDLAMVADQLGALSERTFGVTPEMGKSIGDAMRSMNDAMGSLAQRNRIGASQQQTDAMGSLNEAAQRIEDSMNAMQQGGGQGMGMAGLLARLRRLSSQQEGINDASRNLGAMTPAQAAEMARLAGEQAMVRKSLEQLAREAAGAGELKKLMGDLNELAHQMTEVQTDLSSGNFTPETVKKEDRILSRLLDAQRSTRERDYERRRRSTAGKDFVRESPVPLDLSTIQGRDRLRRDLQKALEEGYAPEYEDLIKRYFETLEQREPQTR
jgi:tetratricopeptide (TPR) repeat protein